ncbi:hypothetical protein Pcinc_022018 [Petrolisthes cinctipes]|uniref:RING-type domain-containing protein n=1 Tax=Petrolisthes cinctipes TaxID=88211 RepID=A0AAE1KHP3_PETCI|nr:hypothetical protein Pcinc_022018 [Petrolisthes cinctipes]
MSGMRRLHVAELHPNLLCILCGGYYVDATTIVECLHSFCKTCIVRYLESSKFCPICDVQVHKTKPLLSIRPDKTLQDIVYKLVPGLYQNEMRKRREFYSGQPEAVPATPEDGGSDLGRWYVLPDDPVSLALHPANPPEAPTTTLKTHLTSLPAKHGPVQSGTGDIMTWSGGHVRYLQCPAGVSLAQLKRLIRAKFGVDISHPITLLANTSEDPLNDALTLVDVAYITSWQKTEPMQLFYRIYERANKKIKLDLELYCSDMSVSEEMPKLEPNDGELTSSMYGQPDIPGGVSDYRSAPLLQAVGALPYHSSPESSTTVVLPCTKSSTNDTQVKGEPCLSSVINTSKENVVTDKSFDVVKSPVVGSIVSISEMTQGSASDSGVSGTNAVDTVVTHPRPYTVPTNSVSVGVAFVPVSVGCVTAGGGVPCAIVSSGGCVPVTGNCLSSSITVPPVSCNTSLHRPLQTSGDIHMNEWITPKPHISGHLRSDSTQVPTDVSSQGKENGKRDDEEGEGVQLKISESGIMSACGKDTTVEGVLNSLGSACELLSKIESGSLCDDFPPVARENNAPKRKSDSMSETKRSKTKNVTVEGKIITVSKNEINGKKTKVNENEEQVTNSNVSNEKSEPVLDNTNKITDTYRASNGEQKADNNKPGSEASIKTDNQKPIKAQSDAQEAKDKSLKNSGNSHIPASLTAASLANLNKPHFKTGPTKVSFGDERVMEQKMSSGSVSNASNVKKEGKQDMVGKTSGCRKSSQPYGYKTLKTPPKSWNPTISREQLALGAGKSSIGKGNKDLPRTNKIFKARNAPRYSESSMEVKKPQIAPSEGSEHKKQDIDIKVDSKIVTPQPVLKKDEPSPTISVSPPTPTSTSTSVSSSQTTSPATTQSTLSNVQSVCSQPNDDKSSKAVETSKISVSKPKPHVSKIEDVGMPLKNVTQISHNSLTKEAKDSTNCSSKIIDNSSSVKGSNSSVTKSIPNGRPSTVNSKTNKSCKISSAQTVNSKSETSLVTAQKASTKSSCGTTQVVAGSVPGLLSSSANINQLNLSGTAVVTCCISQVKVDTMNTITATTPALQQHFAISSPTVGIGIIPSGSLPLPYYSSPSLTYPTYPYFYQGTETISLIPPHTPASFIPSFPACLTPRSPLSPRSIGGAKVMPDLQPSFLPMVPLVSQVPGQSMSPQPMTPPSPRTPTSAQSPRPYPSHSPRLSCSTLPSTLTPHSPKLPVSSVQSSRPHTPSSKQSLPLQPATSQTLKSNMSIASAQSNLFTISSQYEKYNSLSHNTLSATQSNSQFYMNPSSASYTNTQNAFSQLNNFVQVSSQVPIPSTKVTCSSISLPKPSIPPSKSYNSQTGQSAVATSSTPNIQASVPLQSYSFKGCKAQQTPLFSKTSTSSTWTVSQPSESTRLAYSTIPQSTNQSIGASRPDYRSNNIRDKSGVMGCSSSSSSTTVASTSDVTKVAGITPRTVSSLPSSSSVQGTSQPYTGMSSSQINIGGNSTSTGISSHGIQFSVGSSNYSTVHAESMKVTMSSCTPSVNVSAATVGNALFSYPSALWQPPTTSHPKVPSSLSISTALLSTPSSGLLSTTPKFTTSSQVSNANCSLPSSFSSHSVSTKAESPATTHSSVPELCNKSMNSTLLHGRNPLIGSTPVVSSAALSMSMNTTAAVTEPICTTNVLDIAELSKVVSDASVTTNSGSGTTTSQTCTVPSSSTTSTVPQCTTALPTDAKNVTCSTPSIAVSEVCTTGIPNMLSSSITSVGCESSGVLSRSSGNMTIYSGCTDSPAAPSSKETSIVSTLCSKSCTSLPVTSTGTVASTAPLQSKETTTVMENSKCSSTSSHLGCMITTVSGNKTDTTVVSTSTSESSFNVSSTVGLPYSSSAATLSQSNYIFTPSTAGGNSVMTMKERGGFEPQSSACTPVCDVMHVIDAKQQCAEPNVSSGNGPRPCLKS